jgi:hypothetical protein
MQSKYSLLESRVLESCNSWCLDKCKRAQNEGKVCAMCHHRLFLLVLQPAPPPCIHHPCSSARQSLEYIADIARTCGQQLRAITAPAMFCLAPTWPALRALLHTTFSQLVDAGTATLQLDDPHAHSEDAAGQVDCVQLHFERHAGRVPEHSLRYCKVVDGYTGMTKGRLRLRNRRAIRAYASAFRCVACMLYLARKSVIEKPSIFMFAEPRAIGAVHGSDRLSICGGLLAMRVARALSGIDLVFAGHDREKCRGLAVMIASRVYSRHSKSIEVRSSSLFAGGVMARAAGVYMCVLHAVAHEHDSAGKQSIRFILPSAVVVPRVCVRQELQR